jgi:CHAT domain-containing protein
MVGDEKTFLFVVQPQRATGDASDSGITVLELPIGQAALREKVERFRRGIRTSGPLPEDWVRQSHELYDVLIGRAAKWVASSERVLISPDGPLHGVPFGALVTEGPSPGGTSRPRYWIERKPLHVVVSGTLYAELKKGRRPAAPVSLVAFGDPKYAAVSADQPESVTNVQVRSALRRGYSFAPLPGTRTEVETIAQIFQKQAQVYVGDQATEERAKSIAPNVRYVHFATHAFVDERSPVNSAIALTIPATPADGEDNGLLQAWEILEGRPIDADLVVLSACETALGKEMGGEGLMGLTRAFQYAGARSIVASLWSVADESTSELMKRFYGNLKAGRTKDAALRLAQLDLIRGASSQPFHWAAFQLVGDWR